MTTPNFQGGSVEARGVVVPECGEGSAEPVERIGCGLRLATSAMSPAEERGETAKGVAGCPGRRLLRPLCHSKRGGHLDRARAIQEDAMALRRALAAPRRITCRLTRRSLRPW
jgi:hypothetical protein